MTVFYILGLLFLALLILVPLLERSKVRMSEEQTASISRWILPLVMVIAIVQFVMYMING